jgi:ABC-2 type transport system permease protein
MSVFAVANAVATTPRMSAERLVGAYFAEAKYETLRMLRTPAFALPFLGLPVLLYLLFAVVIFGPAIRADAQAGPFVFTAFAVFGVMGPGIFGFGMAVANEREQGLLRLKRALPMPPAAYLVAKLLMALIFAVIVMATLIAALPLGAFRPSASQCLGVTVINVLAALPFCAIGLFIGTRSSGRSAPAFVNVAYQVMMHVSGLFYPLPHVLAVIAPIWPTHHVQQLVLRALGAPSQGNPIVHVAVLAGATLLLTLLSTRRLARVG